MMYRVLLALLAGKAAGFSSMPDPGCTALGPQTDAFPGIGVHFSPAGQESWAGNFGPDTPCGPYCTAEFTMNTITTAAPGSGVTDVDLFMSLAHNPVLAAIAEAFNLTAGITYTTGCASGPGDGPAGGFPGALCGGVGADRYGWWSEICREAVGCAACHECFFPDGYPSECMQTRGGDPYTNFTPRAIFDYMPTLEASEAWIDQTGFGACSEACAERPGEMITVYGPGPCPEGVSPYLCYSENPWIGASFPNTTSFPTEILACSDDYAGAILGWGDGNIDHY
ncbi:hypothetical protein EMIHUDRAFT_443353, partial [Emiliania huxleyi CCMP1516]|uniref:Uncharacterized protein n=2 Tax=Emiliania huxleyi TaxID=2903 RepID=A0A0D3JTN7_EMIH1